MDSCKHKKNQTSKEAQGSGGLALLILPTDQAKQWSLIYIKLRQS